MTVDFLLLAAIGFFAQLVDGALGMAFGVISSSAMLTLGMPPAQASAIVHTAEIFTTAASGASHLYFKNVDWRLVIRLGIAGVLGGAVGNLIDRATSGYVLDFVDAYWGDWHFWAFNVADAAITVGVIFMILDILGFGKRSDGQASINAPNPV